jgi:WD40 repeat protein/Leucine-rich repeat (LRR) protein
MASRSEPGPADAIRFLKNNKGLVILGALSLIALAMYYWQNRSSEKALLYALKRAGARVSQAQGSGQALHDVSFAGGKVGAEELSLIAQLRSTRSLDLSETGVGDGEMKVLTGLSSLTALYLSGSQVSVAGLAELHKLSNLQRLDLSRCRIGDDDLSVLAGFPALDDVNLSGTQVTDAGMGRLSKVPRLSVLGLASTKVSDTGIPTLATLPRLEDLDLSATRLTDAGLDALRPAAGLRALTLRGTKLTDAGLRHLQGLRRLQALVLAMVPISDAGLRHLAGLSRLETLDLSFTRISDAGLAHLRDLPLRKLVLSSTSVTDDGMEVIGGFRLLRYLEIDGAPMHLPAEMARPPQLAAFLRSTPVGWPSITDAGLRPLRSLLALEVLRLGGAGISDAGLVHLAGLRALQHLDLHGTNIGDAGLVHLSGLTDLRRLYLGNTAIKGPGLSDLKGLLRLRELSLGETEVGDAHVESLRALKNLTTLDLSGTEITDEALAMLGTMTALRRLTLGRTGIGDAGLAHLKGLKELRNLGLDGTQVSDNGLRHLEELSELDEVTASQTAISKSLADAFLARDPPVRVRGIQERMVPHRRTAQPDFEETLDAQRVDRHGDPLPKGARARLGTVRLFCRGQSFHLALTADGKTLIAGGQNERVKMWDTHDGRLRHTLPAIQGGCRALALTPDGRLLAMASAEGPIELWETAGGKRLRELTGTWMVATALAFAPDGRSLAVVSYPGTIHVLDIESGKQVLALHGQGRRRMRGGLGEMFANVAFSPDGKTLAASSQQSVATPAWREVNGRRRLLYLTSHTSTIRLWQWPTGKPLAPLLGSNHYLWFDNAEGGRSIVAPARDGSLLVWDVATGQKVRRLPGGSKTFPARAIAWPDGRTVLVRQESDWARWDLRTGRQVGRLDVPGGHLTLSANAKVLATAQAEGYLSLWDAATGKELVPLARHLGLGHPRPVAYAPDGKTIATAGRDQTIRIWERNGRPVRTIAVPGKEPSWVCFSPDGRLLAASLRSYAPPQPVRGMVRVWEAQTGRMVFETPADGWQGALAMAPALGPDGLLAVGRSAFFVPRPEKAPPSSSVVLYDTRSGKARPLDAGSGSIDALALSPDGRLLAWVSGRGEVVLADVGTAKVVRRVPVPRPTPEEMEMQATYLLLFSPDSKRLAIGLGSKGTMLVEATSDGPVRSLPPAGKQPVQALLFRQGRLLSAGRMPVQMGSGYAADVAVHDVQSGQAVRPTWRTKEVLDVIFAPDGSELATTHEGAEVVLWGLAE